MLCLAKCAEIIDVGISKYHTIRLVFVSDLYEAQGVRGSERGSEDVPIHAAYGVEPDHNTHRD